MLTYANGDEYRGEFVHHRRHGRGELRLADGTVYSGEWVRAAAAAMPRSVHCAQVDGKQHGTGALVSERQRFEGAFSAGRRCGRGVVRCVHAAGTFEFTGDWRDDRAAAASELRFAVDAPDAAALRAAAAEAAGPKKKAKDKDKDKDAPVPPDSDCVLPLAREAGFDTEQQFVLTAAPGAVLAPSLRVLCQREGTTVTGEHGRPLTLRLRMTEPQQQQLQQLQAARAKKKDASPLVGPMFCVCAAECSGECASAGCSSLSRWPVARA